MRCACLAVKKYCSSFLLWNILIVFKTNQDQGLQSCRTDHIPLGRSCESPVAITCASSSVSISPVSALSSTSTLDFTTYTEVCETARDISMETHSLKYSIVRWGTSPGWRTMDYLRSLSTGFRNGGEEGRKKFKDYLKTTTGPI